MHPLLADPRRLLVYAVLLSALGAAAAGLQVWLAGGDGGAALLFWLPLALVYGFVALSAYYPCRSLVTGRPLPLLLLLLAASAVAAGAALWLLASLWLQALQLIGGDGGLPALGPRLSLLLFIVGAGGYVLSLLAHALLLAVERGHRAELRASRARLQARDAELQMLRAQIDPHFLFNSLNSISALTAIDPAGARDMTLRLAQFFRRTQALAERDRIVLADELELLAHYLGIERVRFGDNLRHAFDIDRQAQAALLPPLALQPLVENAIKHGLRSCPEGGCITVQARVREDLLYVAIENPVGDLPARSSGNGLGLRNLTQRLATLYGDRARLHWQRREGRFRAELVIPFEAEATA